MKPKEFEIEITINKHWHDTRLAYRKIRGISALSTSWMLHTYYLTAKGTKAGLDRLKTILEEHPVNELEIKRREAATKAFESADLPSVSGTGGWTQDGDFWSMAFFCENDEQPDEPSIKGSFGVRFEPRSAKIKDRWKNADFASRERK
jgi:hypothetical protein